MFRRLLLAIALSLAVLPAAGCDDPFLAQLHERLYVGPQQVDCVGAFPQKCFLVKNRLEGDWELFYEWIEGFEFEPGFNYELIVASWRVRNPLADASGVRYRLLELVSKTPAD